MSDTLLSVREAAEVLGLSRQRVQRLCLQGRLGRKVGTAYVITAVELSAFRRRPRKPGRPVKSGG